MTEKPLSYGKTVAVFREVFNRNSRKLQNMLLFAERYSQKMGKLANHLSKSFTEKSSKKNPPQPSAFHKHIIETGYSSMNLVDPIAEVLPEFDAKLIPQLRTISDEYSARGSALLLPVEAALKEVKKASKAAKAAHKEYRHVGSVIIQRFENNQAKPVDEDQAMFLEKQAAAMEAHKDWNQKRAEFGLIVEVFLSSFEKLESTRYSQIQSLMNNFGDFFESLGSHMIEFGESLLSKVDSVEIDQEQTDITSAVSKVKQVETDDKYQVVPIPPSGSKYFIWKDVYKEELKKGACLKRVREDRYGSFRELMVKQGEIVLVLSEDKGMCKCRNVNASVGLVPSENLEACVN